MLKTLIRNLLTPLRDFIYPQVCFTCNQHLTTSELKICSSCWNSLTTIVPSHPLWTEKQNKLTGDGSISDVFSCYFFEKEGKLQEIIHLLKYEGITHLGIRLGRELGNRILTHQLYRQADFLIPVPLHKAKLRERGYNQSELICKGISEVTKIPTETTILKRTKHTQSQTHLSLEERKQNVSGAFMVEQKHKHLLSGATVILVDDVITTGSTINECAKVLFATGVRQIFAASAALA